MITTKGGKQEVVKAPAHGVNTGIGKPFAVGVLRGKNQGLLRG
jgi:hypothetical protein